MNEKLIYTNTGGPSYSNATIISDGYQGSYWNTEESTRPSIAIDNEGNAHVVWMDYTQGSWSYDKFDSEIMYVKHTSNGWSNVTIVSDVFEGSYWNNGESKNPSLAIDSKGSIHVVWDDISSGPWKASSEDSEIMYASYTTGSGWSNATVISDGYEGSYWNTGESLYPSIAVDNQGFIHVSWHDNSIGSWRDNIGDYEIMYTKYIPGTGWSNVSIISDGYQGSYWNNERSYDPVIQVNNQNHVYIVWEDDTDNIDSWGSDWEIMYSMYTPESGWTHPSIISDGFEGTYWNTGDSRNPHVSVNDNGEVYVAWQDKTDGIWNNSDEDSEIMFTKYTPDVGWENITVISDGYSGFYWNDLSSNHPTILVDREDRIHVAWEDETAGSWGGGSDDFEIMYSIYTSESGWTYPMVISDGFEGSYWNTGNSFWPSIAIDDQGKLHVAWQDYTVGPWGSSLGEIWYCKINTPFDYSKIPGTFTLSTDAKNPDEDGIFNLKWTESENAEEYAIFLVNNGTMEEYASGILDRTFTVIGLSDGNFTFQIKAYNDLGSSSSNKLNVTVKISSSEKDTADNSDDTTDDENNGNGNGSISFGYWYLGFLVIGIIGISSMIYHKQKKQ